MGQPSCSIAYKRLPIRDWSGVFDSSPGSPSVEARHAGGPSIDFGVFADSPDGGAGSMSPLYRSPGQVPYTVPKERPSPPTLFTPGPQTCIGRRLFSPGSPPEKSPTDMRTQLKHIQTQVLSRLSRIEERLPAAPSRDLIQVDTALVEENDRLRSENEELMTELSELRGMVSQIDDIARGLDEMQSYMDERQDTDRALLCDLVDIVEAVVSLIPTLYQTPIPSESKAPNPFDSYRDSLASHEAFMAHLSRHPFVSTEPDNVVVALFKRLESEFSWSESSFLRAAAYVISIGYGGEDETARLEIWASLYHLFSSHRPKMPSLLECDSTLSAKAVWQKSVFDYAYDQFCRLAQVLALFESGCHHTELVKRLGDSISLSPSVKFFDLADSTLLSEWRRQLNIRSVFESSPKPSSKTPQPTTVFDQLIALSKPRTLVPTSTAELESGAVDSWEEDDDDWVKTLSYTRQAFYWSDWSSTQWHRPGYPSTWHRSHFFQNRRLSRQRFRSGSEFVGRFFTRLAQLFGLSQLFGSSRRES